MKKMDMNIKATDWGELYHPECGCLVGNCYYNTCPHGWYKKDLTVKFWETQQYYKNKTEEIQKPKYKQLTLW